MKVAVLKLGGKIHNGANVPGPIGEVLFIIQMLVMGGCDVHAYTQPLKRHSNPISGCTVLDITDESVLNEVKNQGYDACVVVNGSVNFFGGKDDPAQIMNFRVMHDLKDIPIFYCLTDGKLGLKPIVPMIKGRPWVSNYDLEKLSIDDCNIHYVSQLYDRKTNLDLIKKLGVTINSVLYFPFEKIPLLTVGTPSELLSERFDYEQRSIDLLYVGSFRGGTRANKMIEYFYGLPDDISIHVRGTITADDFKKFPVSSLRPPIFGAKVPYTNLFPVLSGSKAAICIGDPMYHGAGVSTRVYEAIVSKQVTFIDRDYDPTGFVYQHSLLKEFCYVSGRDELVKKVRFLKNKTGLHSKITELQSKETMLDATAFSKDFVKLLKGD